jgi:CubicO group peptidase (beta-lactamase class C family)
MLLRLVLIAFLLAGSTGAARAKTVAEAFDAEMRAWMAAHGIVRGSLGVMRDGRLVHVAGFGDRGADARAGIWSLSKAITATCVATLARDKVLSFDSPIGPLLSATFQRHGAPADPRLERATVLHLISHRSGIPSRVGGNRFAPGTGDLLRTHEPPAATVHQLLPEILKLRLTHEPGAEFQYSNVGYLLLGRIVEQATGKSYAQACAERVLRPSGVTDAGLHPKWGRLLDSAAGWELSAAEYLAFARQLRPNRKSILDAATHALLVKPDGFWRDDRKQTAYTLGVIVWPVANALPGLSHTGGWDWAQKDARGGPVDENPGTLFVLASDGVAWFVSFDPLARAGEQRAREELDQAMWRARRSVTDWPSKDLFPAHQVK